MVGIYKYLFDELDMRCEEEVGVNNNFYLDIFFEELEEYGNEDFWRE